MVENKEISKPQMKMKLASQVQPLVFSSENTKEQIRNFYSTFSCAAIKSHNTRYFNLDEKTKIIKELKTQALLQKEKRSTVLNITPINPMKKAEHVLS